MNALQKAIEALDAAERYYAASEEKGGNAHYRSQSERAYEDAAVYAAVAQADALGRIATALESMAADSELAESVAIYGKS